MDGEWQSTACILCECNCGIEVQVEGRHLAKIRGDRAHPGSQGYTCNKAMRLDHYQNGGRRLTSPLRRRTDGTHEEIGWDTAITEIAQRLAGIRDEHGGESIFYYGGGGQGNHLGGGYSGAFLRALGSKWKSNALAQEKTGEGWVDAHLYGGHTRGEFEHAEVSVFVGKNPWMSQSFPRARVTLKEIEKDPERSMIVIDPVVTDTAKMADLHLRVKPGTDAWCLAALAAVLVQEGLTDDDFLARHTHGAGAVVEALAEVPVADYSDRCGVDEALIRAAARRIGSADSVSVFEDLGIQQAPHSVLNSYLNKLLWILTGSFARPGTMHLHSWMAQLARYDTRERRTPVTGELVMGGLVPCNVIAEEILTDHPKRLRAMVIESSNPAHSLADSERFGEALEALDCVVVMDVAMTETRPSRRLRAARGEPVREARGDLLQPRVPAQHLPAARPAVRSAARHAARGRDLGAAGQGAGRDRRGRARPAARGGGRGARRVRRGAVAGGDGPTRGWPSCCPSCSTRRLGPRCPRAWPAPPPCGGWRSAAR